MTQFVADIINLAFGFRKVIAWILLLIIGILFRLKNFINGSEFVDLVKNTFIAFCAVNGVEHLVSVVKEYVNAQGQPISQVPEGDDLVGPDGTTNTEPPAK